MKTDAELSDHLLGTTWRPFTRGWKLAFAICGLLTILLVAMLLLTALRGIGMWGNNIPVGWGFGIINFVWWIGIGHAGTFLSAILLVLEQKRTRTPINRFAEGMTLFAVVQAGVFPLIHLGRPWFAYWLFPYPSVMGVWPQVRSALPWDAAAISTYLILSILFFYLGLIPDLASLRDRAPSRARRLVYGVFALGWRGSGEQWRRFRTAYIVLAGIATPLVVSVHSIVSLDFASTGLAGWHSTIFPPFFVAGAIFSGLAMVLTLVIPVRRVFGLQDQITPKIFDSLGKLILVTSSIAMYSYAVELFIAWYTGDTYEISQHLHTRLTGPYAWVFYSEIFCNVLVPQLLWSRRLRTNVAFLFCASLVINVGMWLERFEIVVVSLSRDFLPSSWHQFAPTWVDLGLLAGTLGCFGFLFLGFLRFVPFIPVAETKALRREVA